MLLNGVDPHFGVATLAIGLGYHGYRKGSLSASGGLAAAGVGYAHLANPHPAFGLLLLSFYFAGSRATKVKAQRKALLEYEGGGHKSAAGGRRNASQVLCNSLLRTSPAPPYLSVYSPFRFQRRFRRWCTAGYFLLSRPLIRVALAHQPAGCKGQETPPRFWQLRSCSSLRDTMPAAWATHWPASLGF